MILKNFWKNEDGATAIEYGLIAALIAVVIIISLFCWLFDFIFSTLFVWMKVLDMRS